MVTDYLSGQEKAYAVRNALNELQAAYGAGARLAPDRIEQALACDPKDEETRLGLITKALDLVGRQQRSDRAYED